MADRCSSKYALVSGDGWELLRRVCGHPGQAVWGLLKADDVHKPRWIMLYDMATGSQKVMAPDVQPEAMYHAPEDLVPSLSSFLNETLLLVIAYLSTVWLLVERMTSNFSWESFIVVSGTYIAHAMVLKQRGEVFALGLQYEEVLETSGLLLRLPRRMRTALAFGLVVLLLGVQVVRFLVKASTQSDGATETAKWSTIQLSDIGSAATFLIFILMHAASMRKAIRAFGSWRTPQMRQNEILAVLTKQLAVTSERPEKLSGPRAWKLLVVQLTTLIVALVGMVVLTSETVVRKFAAGA